LFTSENTQSALQLAAGIGNVFDLTTLAAIYDKSRLETAIDLWEAVQAGLIIPLGEDYKFIQAAVLTTSSYFTDNDPNDNSSSLTGLAMVKALAIHPRDETERFVKTPGFIPQ
jgi:hypothetical protein